MESSGNSLKKAGLICAQETKLAASIGQLPSATFRTKGASSTHEDRRGSRQSLN